MAAGWIGQTISITAMNMRNIPLRPWSSGVAVLGVAAVVGVFAGVLSMAAGFQRTMVAAGTDDTAIVFRAGATTELNSGLTFDQTQIIKQAPGVLSENDEAVASSELYVVVDIEKKSTQTTANVPLRGVEPGAFKVRDNIRIVEGRNFTAGRNELIAGRSAQQMFAGLEVGSTIRFGQTEWQVVGAFEADGSVTESELWCDVRVLQPAYRRGNSYQSVRLKLESPDELEAVETALAADPRVDVDIFNEREYYASQSQNLTRFIRIVGYPVTIIMAIGAIFVALNTMYSSVAARSREIATLRALGFGPVSVAMSTLVESAVLSVVGGVIGVVVVYLLFNGFTVSTLNGASFSQVVFSFAVTGRLVVQGIIAAVIIGLIGGFFPAVRAARQPIVSALRGL